MAKITIICGRRPRWFRIGVFSQLTPVRIILAGVAVYGPHWFTVG